MKTALILTTYNRPHYLSKCLDSLRELTVKPDLFIPIDDGSTDNRTLDLLYRFRAFKNAQPIIKRENKGIKDSLLRGFSAAFEQGYDYAINLDGDAIVKPEFIETLLYLKHQFPENIISGFNCNHPANPMQGFGEGYVKRNHCNGINMLIDKGQFRDIVKPALLREGNWDFNSTNHLPFIISMPSVVQHIGLTSSMGHVGADVACDY